MQVKLLDTPPASGTTPKHSYGRAAAPTWVEFQLSDDRAWLGAFGDHGTSLYSSATVFADGRTVFVIAHGQGYVVDGLTGRLLHKTRWNYFYFAIAVPAADFVVACDNTQLFILGPDGERWRTDRVADDGIVLDEATRDTVRGKLWQARGPEGWYAFVLQLAERRVEQGPYLTDDFQKFVPGAA